MDPSSGRFTSVDPFPGYRQAPQSLHRYLYGYASPANYCDPSGEFNLISAITSSVIRAYTASVATISYTGYVIASRSNMLFYQLTNAIRMGHTRLMTAFNGSVELSSAQAARINTIKNIAHSWKSRNNLSGDILDAGHIEKLENGIVGLEKSIVSLQNSLNNPNLNRATRIAIEQAIEEAQTLVTVAKGLIGR